jgi:hypothetical protein
MECGMKWFIISSLAFLGFATVALLSEVPLISALYGFSAGIWITIALGCFFRLKIYSQDD